MERGSLRGIALFRWGAWAWMATVVVLNRDDLEHPWIAWSLVAAALAVTTAATVTARTDPYRLLSPPAILVELVLGATLQFAGGWAYRADPFSSSHALGSAWPLAGVFTAGVRMGALPAAISGALLGVARVLQPVTAGTPLADVDRSQWFSVASTVILYTLAGAIGGHVTKLLDRYARDVSSARARAEVARTLHDGVLQTLTIIERRTDDPQLARLAREQERDLRAWLFDDPLGAGSAAGAENESHHLGPMLLSAAARFESTFGGRVDVVLAPDLPSVRAASGDALAGAVGEALINAGKHARATTLTIYAEPADPAGLGGSTGIVCSIRDDGDGFDTAATIEGVGLARSIRGRVEDAGGRVEIDSRVGGGTEVRVWLPA